MWHRNQNVESNETKMNLPGPNLPILVQNLGLLVYSIKYFEMTDHKVMSLMPGIPCAQITLNNLACSLVQRYVSAINGTSRNCVEEANNMWSLFDSTGGHDLHCTSCGKVMFSQACVKNSGADTPPAQCMLGNTHPAQCMLGYTPPGQTRPLGRHPHSRRHCSGRYASNWNASLLHMVCHLAVQTVNKSTDILSNKLTVNPDHFINTNYMLSWIKREDWFSFRSNRSGLFNE